MWDNLYTILTVAGIVFGIGLIIFLFSERLYDSSITLMPESQSQESSASQLLRRYGGYLGIGGRAETSGETISPDLYPEIIVSTPFLLELVQEDLHFSNHDTTVSLYTYYHELYEPPFFEQAGNFLWDITLGLPGTIKGLFSDNTTPLPPVNFEAYEDREGPIDLDSRIGQVTNYVTDLISIQRQPQTGFVVINAQLRDPVASAELVKVVKEQVTKYVTEYRTEKAMSDLEFVRKQYQQAEKEFRVAQDSLANFRDRNRNLATAQAQTREQRLQAEYDLRFEVYNSIAQQLEQAKLKVQEQTPVFSTLEPVSISGSPDTPNAEVIFIGSIFLGIFFGVAYVYIRQFYFYLLPKFKSR